MAHACMQMCNNFAWRCVLVGQHELCYDMLGGRGGCLALQTARRNGRTTPSSSPAAPGANGSLCVQLMMCSNETFCAQITHSIVCAHTHTHVCNCSCVQAVSGLQPDGRQVVSRGQSEAANYKSCVPIQQRNTVLVVQLRATHIARQQRQRAPHIAVSQVMQRDSCAMLALS